MFPVVIFMIHQRSAKRYNSKKYAIVKKPEETVI